MKRKGFLDGYPTYDTSKGFGNSQKWKAAFKERMTKEEAREILEKAEETPYSILEISMSTSLVEIKKAVKRMLKEWHPDRNQHRIIEAEEMTKKILAAYKTLIP